jgi:hypothetical protein
MLNAPDDLAPFGYVTKQHIEMLRNNKIRVLHAKDVYMSPSRVAWYYCYVEPWVCDLRSAYKSQPNFAGLIEIEFIAAAGCR